jgi:hypothetical protein
MDQSWDEVLRIMDDDDEDDDAAFSWPDAGVWRRVVDRAQAELGNVSVFDSELIREIDHEPTSVQLTLLHDSGGMHAPYGATGSDAVRQLTVMYQLAGMVEEETGLECYDPQVGMPLRDAATDLSLGLAPFEMFGRMFGHDGGARTETEA